MKRPQHFVLPEAQIDWLREEAKRRDCSMAQVVRDLIREEQERRAKDARREVVGE